MQNMTLKVDKKVLTITVDLSKNCGPSKSGKNTIIASSKGNRPVPGFEDMFIGLNIYKWGV